MFLYVVENKLWNAERVDSEGVLATIKVTSSEFFPQM